MNSGNIIPLEAKYLKEVPTVYNGFLILTHLSMVRIFFVKKRCCLFKDKSMKMEVV